MYLETAPTDTTIRGKKTLLRSVGPKELLDLQHTTLDVTARSNYGKINSISDKYTRRSKDPAIRDTFGEITVATNNGIGQLYMLDMLTQRYLSSRIPIPTLEYGGKIRAIYVLQDEPRVVEHARFEQLDLSRFIQCVTNTYEQTLIQQFVAADGQAQRILGKRMMERTSKRIREDAQRIIRISRLSITQLQYLIRYSQRALEGEKIPIRYYCEQDIFDIPLRNRKR